MYYLGVFIYSQLFAAVIGYNSSKSASLYITYKDVWMYIKPLIVNALAVVILVNDFGLHNTFFALKLLYFCVFASTVVFLHAKIFKSMCVAVSVWAPSEN